MRQIIRINVNNVLDTIFWDIAQNALAFNISFIAKYQPKLAIELLQLYAKTHAITENDPEAPDEDYALFAEAVMKMARDISKE